MVYVRSGSRIWVTTSRTSVKARAWRLDPCVAGLIRAGTSCVAFRGTVRAYDLLDTSSWIPAAASGLRLSRAAAAFSLKNARFFGGYAVDAHRVPLAWTPPARVFAEIALERTALIERSSDGHEVVTFEDFGSEGDRTSLPSRRSFRAPREVADPLDGVPAAVRDRIGRSGEAVLAVAGDAGEQMSVLPVRWVLDAGGMHAALSEDALRLSPAGPAPTMALAVDRASRWRASAMVGVMVRGPGSVFWPPLLTSGRRAVADLVERAGGAAGSALVRVTARRVVWWRGWSGGTVVRR
jgi:hypothetical protein